MSVSQAASSPVAGTAVSGTVAATDLTAGPPILIPARERDRTFLYALGIVLLLHVGTLVASIQLGEAPAADESPRERRGQLERSQIVTVDLVEAPDENATSKLSQIGAESPPVPPAPPAEATPPSEESPPVPQAKPEPKRETAKPEAKPAKPVPPALSVDDFDVSLNEYAKAVEAAQAARRQNRQPPAASERARQLGAGAVGKQSAYTKSVLALLARTKPELFVSRGEVLVAFELDKAGKVKGLRVIESSRDALIDKTVVDWLKTTKYPLPPPDATADDLVYVIHFTVSG